MKLFLTSSCISENLQEPFLKFLGKPPGEVKLYFIPTASDVETEKFFIVKSMDDLAAVGINPIWYPLRLKTREQVAQELADADVIWVNGGNTFYLLDVARKTGFMETVDDLVRNKGVLYGGTSAGSILVSPSIEIAGWGEDADPNDVGLTDLTGLNLARIYTQVHYEPAAHEAMLKSKKCEFPIYAIPNGAAVEIDGDTIILHGDIEIFRNG